MFKYLVVICLVALNLFAWEIALLKKEKQEVLIQKKAAIEASARQLKYNWVSPITLSASYTKSSNNDEFLFGGSVQLNQDIFRSGGIFYALDYADIKLASDLIGWEKESAGYFEELFVALLELKKLQLQLKQSEYKYKNSEIEVFLKKEQYKNGYVDITEFNNALIDKNSLLKTIMTTKQSIDEKRIALMQLTDLAPETITLPRFAVLSEETYKKNSFNILEAKLSTALADRQYDLTVTDYLPALSVNGQYGYQDYSSSYFQGGGQESTYHSIGLTLSMPLDFNTKAALQENKAAYLQNKWQLSDTEADELALYRQSMSRIGNYREHNKITRDNIRLYSDLVDISDQGVKAGYTAGYDSQTLQNTKKVDELEIAINDVNIQIELAQLYFATHAQEDGHENGYARDR